MSRPTDEELFAGYVGGNAEAFQELFARYGPVVWRIMARDIRRRQDAEELVQDTFLHLHRAAADFRQGAPLRPWLVTIALNLKREYFRRKGRRPETQLVLDGRSDPRVEPEPVVEREHARRQIEHALTVLTPAQREVVELHWFGGLSFREISHQVGASLSAVKVRAHRGYERMRTALGVKP